MDKKVFDNKKQLEEYINRTNLTNEKYGKYDFENCRFRFEVVFSEILEEFEEEAIFIDAKFERKFSFENIVFNKKADFSGSRFGAVTNFKKAIFKNKFIAPNFISPTYFKGAEFHSTTVFGNTFEYLDLSDCLFSEKLDLSNRRFKTTLLLFDSVFEKEVLFNNTTFEGKINAWNTTFKNDVNFEWGNFRKKLNLTESKIEGLCNLYGVNFEENAYFYKTYFGEIDLKNTVIEKGVFFLDAKIKKSKRETNRIIKNEFLRQNNRIEALNYHQTEMLAFLRELGGKIVTNLKNFELWSLLKNLGNLIILIFNYISNGFGLWWVLGLIFLITTTLLIYNWYISTLPIAVDNNYWKYYVEFINPTHKYEFIKDGEYTLSQKSYLIDFLGRVASSLGIYQTVQAFRKYGKI